MKPAQSEDKDYSTDQGMQQENGIEYAKAKKEKGVGKKKRIEILKKFTQEALKLHGPLIRSIVLFGSTARGSFKGESDIDIFVIVDDTRQRISPHVRNRSADARA